MQLSTQEFFIVFSQCEHCKTHVVNTATLATICLNLFARQFTIKAMIRTNFSVLL